MLVGYDADCEGVFFQDFRAWSQHWAIATLPGGGSMHPRGDEWTYFNGDGTRLRDAITTTIGERAYLGLFSLASVAAIAWLVISYRTALASADNVVLFDLGSAVRDLAIPVTSIAFLIGVPGLMTANPTAVGQSGAATREESVRGILRVTLHPSLWGVALWSLIHLSATGAVASVILFVSLCLLSLLGTLSIVSKRR